MLIYPAIDLYEGQAVRLLRGDYNRMTVYNPDPLSVARDFAAQGATHIHLVDLEGAKTGGTPNLDVICRIKKEAGLFAEVGGGVRSMEVVVRYIEAGIDRVILGTAAVENPDFAREAAAKYGEKIAIGVDIRDGFVAVKGWTEQSDMEAFSFCERMQAMGVGTVICTDISRDGAMKGANIGLYEKLAKRLTMNVIASGGVSSMDDVKALCKLGINGAIVGKAYYTGAISLREAIEVAK